MERGGVEVGKNLTPPLQISASDRAIGLKICMSIVPDVDYKTELVYLGVLNYI